MCCLITTILKTFSVKIRIIYQVLNFHNFSEPQYKQKKVIMLTSLKKMGLDDTYMKGNNMDKT